MSLAARDEWPALAIDISRVRAFSCALVARYSDIRTACPLAAGPKVDRRGWHVYGRTGDLGEIAARPPG